MKKLKYMVCALVLFSANANAALIDLTINGVVEGALNWGGLTAGDSISANLVLDTEGYTGTGSETFYFTGSNTLDITAGTFSFDESMDSALTSSITFQNGELADLNFGALFGINGAPEEFDSFGLGILAQRSVTTGNGGNAVTTDYVLSAHWEATTLSPVPVPAALWLFGSGLIGLAGLAKRRKA
ncbi:MAG: hypothetical protein DIZ80_03205 [endosymbiont of Galathealinum brachiosum]|uniref:Ice-binding protein C-terminal domain-containing protein n=1 Tax=endosymbiont of Galathealinum brachiosum TaxID=2200906 RepID=A0A370DHY8_9GAMM|nr:MAG: hypothetical protein DIZ80_03205 [endosymbiont of Galathealinum brachiosum]